MSVYITTHVWHNSQLRGTALLLVLALADQANDEGISWPSVATLAHKTRLSERTVQNLLPDVLATGEVEVIREARGGHSPRVYRVLAPPPPQRAPHMRRGAKSAPIPDSRGEDSAPLRESGDSGVQSGAARGATLDSGVQISQPGVQLSASRGEARCTQTVLNRVNRQLEPCTEPSRVRANGHSKVPNESCELCERPIAHGEPVIRLGDGSRACFACARQPGEPHKRAGPAAVGSSLGPGRKQRVAAGDLDPRARREMQR